MDPFVLLREKRNPPKDTKPSFSGRTIIVTGANTGVGFEAAVKCAQSDAQRLILAVRTLSKGEEAKRLIAERTAAAATTKSSTVIDVWQLDMMDYDSIRAFARRANTELNRLDYAILNAGIVAFTYEQSKYSWERTLQVNVLSTALLAVLLTPKLHASRTTDFHPVIELVGSGAHYWPKKLDSPTTPLAAANLEKNFGDSQKQYALSKLLLMAVPYWLTVLADQPASSNDPQAQAREPHFFVTTVCPGATKSNLGSDANSWILRTALKVFRAGFQRETEEGARTYISGLTQGVAAHGRFWRDDAVQEPAPLLQGPDGKKFQATIAREIYDILLKDVPEISAYPPPSL